ncbi:MAG: PKD domain-containing protein [Bacteroidetes bacterium]|nr:MAG: PKD domain-containing protein [Bacteroidota bacterium]
MKKLILSIVCLLWMLSANAQSSGGVYIEYKDANNGNWPVAVPTSVNNSDSATVTQAFQYNGVYLGPGVAADSFYTTTSYTSRLITINYFACGSWHKIDTFFSSSNWYLNLVITLPCDPPCFAGYNIGSTNNQLIQFTPHQQLSGYSHFWDFGNGATSTQTSPSYFYFTSGSYDIVHIVSNAQLGCSDTARSTLYINIPCSADFEYRGEELKVDFKSRYKDQSWNHTWNFGDGSTSNSIDPTHTYSQYGAYSVVHTISGNGCYKSQTYMVYVNNSCEAKFGLRDGNTINNLVTIDSSTYNSSYFTRFYWETESGNTYTSNGTIHLGFNSPGVKTVRLILQNGTCIDTAYRQDSVGMDCRKPLINLSQQYAPYGQNYSIYVNYTDVINGADYSWKWPDNSRSNGYSSAYTSVSQDSVDIRLYLDNKLNCLDSFNYRVRMPYDSSLVLDSIRITHGENSGFFSFLGFGKGYKTGGYIDYGDGTRDSTGFRYTNFNYKSHWYLQAGTYQVKMVVWNANFRDSLTVTVQSQSNQCYFGSPDRKITKSQYSSPSGKVSYYSNIAYNNSHYSAIGLKLKYHWVFGDGDSLDNEYSSTTHTYQYNGQYQVKLEVNDSLGLCSLSADTIMSITNAQNGGNCIATFNAHAISTAKYRFTPTDTLADTYAWDFGDGSISNLKYPVHEYSTTGLKTVKLTIFKTSQGCIQSSQLTIYSNANCNANFNYSQTLPYEILFKRGSTVSNFSSTRWDFGDGTIQITASDTISHVYASQGNYMVKATAVDPSNNAASTSCIKTTSLTLNNCGLLGQSYQILLGQVSFDDTLRADFDSLKVYVITYNSSLGILAAYDSMTLRNTDTGFFHFNLTCVQGPILVKAACMAGSKYYSDFLPTYSDSATLWSNANHYVNRIGYQFANINMRRGNNPGGSGFIGGYVSQGANKNGAGLDGIQINLYTLDDQPVTYTYSFNAGRYEFNNIPYGSYKLMVEIPGKLPSIHYVTLSQSTKSVDDIDFEINSKDIGVINHLAVIKSSVFKAYPNPTTGKVRIASTSKYPLKWTELRDVNGKQIAIQPNRYSDTEIELDLSALPSGVYLLTAGDETYLSRIRIVKQ